VARCVSALSRTRPRTRAGGPRSRGLWQRSPENETGPVNLLHHGEKQLADFGRTVIIGVLARFVMNQSIIVHCSAPALLVGHVREDRRHFLIEAVILASNSAVALSAAAAQECHSVKRRAKLGHYHSPISTYPASGLGRTVPHPIRADMMGHGHAQVIAGVTSGLGQRFAAPSRGQNNRRHDERLDRLWHN